MTFKEAEKVYKKHGLKFYLDPNNYPYTWWEDLSKTEDYEEILTESELDELTDAFEILSSES